MGAPLRLLLTAACVASLIGDALGNCVSARWGGHENGHPVELDPITVDLTDEHVIVKIKVGLGCNLVGAQVSCCEAKHLTFINDRTVLIHAKEINTVGKLDVVIYCTPVYIPPATEQ